MLRPPWRLLGIAATGTAAFALPAALAATGPSVGRLQADKRSAGEQRRSAVLSLYSLDSRLAAARDRLAALQRSEAALRAQRAVLGRELRLAAVDERLSQRHLAARLRAIYDHGSASTLDAIFGASSLGDALDQLDNLDRVSSMDGRIVLQLRSARLQERSARRRLAAREARLQAAIAQARDEARSLAAVRSERAAYVARLASREALDAAGIARLDARARAAEAKAAALTHSPPRALVGAPVPERTTLLATGSTITVVSTGYCLGGSTSTGIPVGWGVAAVDPRVIPLGTHLTIPGYGAAVAADTGGAIVGTRIDLWFPTCAQAGGWGTRSVTIALH